MWSVPGLKELFDRQSLFLTRVNGRSLHSKVITEDLRTDLLDAHHVYRFPEFLHIIAKSLANHSQLLLESLHACNHVCTAYLRRREQPLQQLYVSQWVARIVLVIQSSPCIEHNFETLTALFRERDQNKMKLHVEICHVSPILPRSNNLLDVRLRNRLIVSFPSPIQDRSRLMEAPRSLDTKLVPPIRPSVLITLEIFHLGNAFGVSTPNPEQNATENHSTATRTTRTQHCRSATMLKKYECEPVSCALVLF